MLSEGEAGSVISCNCIKLVAQDVLDRMDWEGRMLSLVEPEEACMDELPMIGAQSVTNRRLFRCPSHPFETGVIWVPVTSRDLGYGDACSVCGTRLLVQP
jgi:hypothetical protein